MKKRLLSLLCAGLFLLPLTGCWEEEPDDTGGALVPEELLEDSIQEEEPEVLLPLSFSLPYSADQTLDPVTCADGMQQVSVLCCTKGCFNWTRRWSPSLGCVRATPMIRRLLPTFSLSEPASCSPMGPPSPPVTWQLPCNGPRAPSGTAPGCPKWSPPPPGRVS